MWIRMPNRIRIFEYTFKELLKEDCYEFKTMVNSKNKSVGKF